jgi:hypothetical protein
MAHKVHFLATTGGKALCAVRSAANGKMRANSRATYATIPADHIVRPDEFRATPAADRCAHCSERFTEAMNSRRAKTGKPLYADAFTQTLK